MGLLVMEAIHALRDGVIQSSCCTRTHRCQSLRPQALPASGQGPSSRQPGTMMIVDMELPLRNQDTRLLRTDDSTDNDKIVVCFMR